MAIADIRKMMAVGVPAETAKVIDEVVTTSGASIAWADVTGKPATFDPTIGTTATTAMAGNTAIPAASSTAPAALAAAAAVGVGTTFARADHVHAIPGVSAGAVRGTVLIQAAEADLAGGADLPTTVTKVNAILAKLRTAGIISP